MTPEIEELLNAARWALREMCMTNAPRNSFTDAVDRLDAAITAVRKQADTGVKG
jgi:hypothetical protein